MKKKRNLLPFPKGKKLVLRMKLLSLFLFAFIIQANASIYSQTKKLSLKVTNTSIEEVFKLFEEQSDFSFIYRSDIFKGEEMIDVDVKNISIENFLDEYLLPMGFEYDVVNQSVILKKSPETISPKLEADVPQEKKVSGTVTDNTGALLPGVTITVVGSTRGVITDVDGKFEMTNVKPSDKLVFSFIGMTTQVIDVADQTEFKVILSAKTEELEDVTVVAFAKQKKESVIGSITTVKPADLKIPSSNLTTALAGRMSGLISYQRSGEPGADNADFFIRGVTTFGYKKDPLILVDNNEVSTEVLSRMQPDNIASFSIMKDATATALYGSRGANGVILVTTKEGVEGKAKINIRYEESISKPTQMVELADPITYMQLHNEAVRTRDPLGVTPYSPSKIANTIAGTSPYVYPAMDWYNTLFKNQTQNHRFNFNVSGGGKVARYYLAGNVVNDNGILKVDQKNNFNNNIKLNRYGLRSNININITRTTEAVIRLSGSFDDYTGPIKGGTDLFEMAMQTNPVLFPAYFPPDEANEHTKHILFGNYDRAQYNNPYAEMTKGYKDYTVSRMFAQFELKQKLDFITEGLMFRAMFNTNRYSRFDVQRFYNPFYYQVAGYNRQTDEYALMPINETTGTEYLGYSEGDKDINSTTYFESALNWNRTFSDKHALSGLLVYTMREYLVANAGDLQKSLPYRNLNLAGRATYSFNSRYFIEANFGYNGSERFSKTERFGFFPSAGLAWFVSNEDFWGLQVKKVINKLKLKATYGLVGNDAIGDENDRFFYLSQVNMNNSDLGSAFGTYGNAGGYSLNGVSVSRYPNSDITWETAEKLNIGFEMGLWDMIDLQADFFTENRTNILMTRSSIPTSMGLQAPTRANVGEASSKGIDVSFNFNKSINNDLWISSLANFTYATSAFEVYEEPDYSSTPWVSRVGHSLNQNWGYVAERLFVDEDEIANSPVQFGDYRAGDIKYKDINGDGKISPLDMVPMGYPTSPEIVYGFGASAGYKALDFSFFFQGLARESFWIDQTATAPFINQQNALLEEYANDHWSETNRNVYAIWPRLSETHIENNQQPSNWFMRDGSFLRLKSVELGYSLPRAFISKAKLTNCRIYFSGTNLLTFSKFKMWDPEMGGNGLGYPIQKVFNFGIQLSF